MFPYTTGTDIQALRGNFNGPNALLGDNSSEIDVETKKLGARSLNSESLNEPRKRSKLDVSTSSQENKSQAHSLYIVDGQGEADQLALLNSLRQQQQDHFKSANTMIEISPALADATLLQKMGATNSLYRGMAPVYQLSPSPLYPGALQPQYLNGYIQGIQVAGLGVSGLPVMTGGVQHPSILGQVGLNHQGSSYLASSQASMMLTGASAQAPFAVSTQAPPPAPLAPMSSINNNLNTTASLSPVDGMPLQLPTIMGQPEDVSRLSLHQVLLRNQIEVFEATEDDATTHTRGRNKRIQVGQVGIRCRHCKHLPILQRQKGSTYFPNSLTGLYQAAQNMSSVHMQTGVCMEMPLDVKSQFAHSMCFSKAHQSGAGRPFWASSGKKIGLVDTEQHGIRFVRTLPQDAKVVEKPLKVYSYPRASKKSSDTKSPDAKPAKKQ